MTSALIHYAAVKAPYKQNQYGYTWRAVWIPKIFNGKNRCFHVELRGLQLPPDISDVEHSSPGADANRRLLLDPLHRGALADPNSRTGTYQHHAGYVPATLFRKPSKRGIHTPAQ